MYCVFIANRTRRRKRRSGTVLHELDGEKNKSREKKNSERERGTWTRTASETLARSITADYFEIFDKHRTCHFRPTIVAVDHARYLPSTVSWNERDRQCTYHVGIDEDTSILVQFQSFNFDFFLIHSSTCIFD